LWRILVIKKYYKHLSSLSTGCKRRFKGKETIYRDKDWKCIEMKNNFISDLRKDSTSNLPIFTHAIEKVMKLYEEQEMIGASKRFVLFSFFTFFYA